MRKLWSGTDEVFFQNLFAYLKRKFPYRLSAMELMQKDTRVNIYHETIVALEQIHEVLRNIGDGSAPDQDDYENAVKTGNNDQVQEIIEFYKKLALIPNSETSIAFKNFYRMYYGDTLIRNYSHFLKQHDGLYEEFRRSNTWTQQTFQKDRVFKFIEAYQASLLQEKVLSSSIQEDIERQNQLYDRLMRDYDELVQRNVKIGVSVFDIVLPGSLISSGTTREMSSRSFLFEVISSLNHDFEDNDAILMQVNHANLISGNNFIISYLLVYKATIYENPRQLIEFTQSAIFEIVGRRFVDRLEVIDRENLLKKLYPDEVFVGELSSKKEKLVLRNKFLKYFLSSMFLFNLDKDSQFQEQEDLRGELFNTYRFYKEKIYHPREAPKHKEHIEKEPVQKNTIEYLHELVTANDDVKKPDKYFSVRDLPQDVAERIQGIRYLYLQQGVTSVSLDIIEDLIRIEYFLARLMYILVFEFEGVVNAQKFEKSPKFSKLSLLFQLFTLISVMDCLRDKRRLPQELSAKSIHFIRQFRDFFERGYLISDLNQLKKHLEMYKTHWLKPVLQKEKQFSDKALNNQNAIQTYLQEVFKQDVDIVVMRFIFRCGYLNGTTEAKLFDEMFRDYTENLKRRNTGGACLVAQAGVYIPYKKEHYIDATLLFRWKKTEDTDPQVLSDAVIKYWENYVDQKRDQIQTYNKKHGKKYTGNQTNPFALFKNAILGATPVSVVKTENLLSHEYVEIFRGQTKIRTLLMQNVSKFYAYCPLILVDELDLENLPRKNYLILGRNRKPYAKKVEGAAENTNGNGDEQCKESVTPDPKSLQATHMLNTDQRVVSIESDDNTLLEDENVEAELSIDGEVEEQDTIVDDSDGVLIPDKSETLAESSSQALSSVVGNSDNIQTVQTATSNKAQYLAMNHRKKHSFLKPDPDQIAAEARVKLKNKDV